MHNVNSPNIAMNRMHDAVAYPACKGYPQGLYHNYRMYTQPIQIEFHYYTGKLFWLLSNDKCHVRNLNYTIANEPDRWLKERQFICTSLQNF